MKNKAQKQSNTIVKMFQQMQPGFYVCHTRQNFIVLSQSQSESQISKLVSEFLFKRIGYYLKTFLSLEKASVVASQQYHRRNLANLIVSCREEIQESAVEGSCSFGACFVFDNELYSIRSSGVDMYLIDEFNSKIWPINGSTDYQNCKKVRSKGIEQGYFSTNMAKIKAQYIYEQTDFFKRQVYFQKVSKQRLKQGQNLKLLIGCTQTFQILTPDILFKYFKDNSQKSDCQKVNGLLEEAKKKTKSVYNLDLSLVCWKVNVFLNQRQSKVK